MALACRDRGGARKHRQAKDPRGKHLNARLKQAGNWTEIWRGFYAAVLSALCLGITCWLVYVVTHCWATVHGQDIQWKFLRRAPSHTAKNQTSLRQPKSGNFTSGTGPPFHQQVNASTRKPFQKTHTNSLKTKTSESTFLSEAPRFPKEHCFGEDYQAGKSNMYEDVYGEMVENTEVLGERPVPLPLCPPQSSHGLTWSRTPASAVTGRRLTIWAMARPLKTKNNTK